MFDKITSRVSKLCYNLNMKYVDPVSYTVFPPKCLCFVNDILKKFGAIPILIISLTEKFRAGQLVVVRWAVVAAII